MNYIELINQFWQLNEEHSFTANEVATYFYLLNTANKLGWKNPFNQSNGYITNALGMSEPTLIRVRNNLKQFGLIEFKSDKGRKNLTQYYLKYLNSFSNAVSIPVSNNGYDGDKYLNDFSIPVSNAVSIPVSNAVSIPIENALDNNKHKLNYTKQNNDVVVNGADFPINGSKDRESNFPPDPAPPPRVLFLGIDDLLEECKRDPAFFEPICMQNHISPEVMASWLNAFNRQLRFTGEETKLSREYRKHFANWLRYQDLKSDPAKYSPVLKNENNGRKADKQVMQPAGSVIPAGNRSYGKL